MVSRLVAQVDETSVEAPVVDDEERVVKYLGVSDAAAAMMLMK